MESISLDARSRSLVNILASGFTNLPISVHLRPAIGLIKLVTILLDQYCRTKYPALQRLIPIRNAAQHKLLSLHQYPLDPITDLCQAALLVYSDMIIFPLPSLTGLRNRLAARLDESLTRALSQPHLSSSDLNFTSTSLLPLYLWAAAFGAMAAEQNVRLRAEFCVRVVDLATRLGVLDFKEFKMSLEMFMWWNDVCGPSARSLWVELCHS